MKCVTLHASCVALQGQGVLILGQSGSGKSSLALELMGYGADLVADDRTNLTRTGASILATAPATIANMIEARGIGLLNAESISQATIHCVVDMDQIETKRLPEPRNYTLLGLEIPLLHKIGNPSFAASLLQFIKAGRQDAT